LHNYADFTGAMGGTYKAPTGKEAACAQKGCLLSIVYFLLIIFPITHNLNIVSRHSVELENEPRCNSKEERLKKSCSSLFSETNIDELWIYRKSCPLAANWTCSLCGGNSSQPTFPDKIPAYSSLILKSSRLFGSAVAIRMHLQSTWFSPRDLGLHLISFDGKRTVHLRGLETERCCALVTVPLGDLENEFWSGLDLRNHGQHEMSLSFLDALYLRVRSPAELLNQQVSRLILTFTQKAVHFKFVIGRQGT
jgi:hypothetical protein